MKILQVAEWTVEFGGQEHSGWLPTGATIPRATPLIRVELALAILKEQQGGYISQWRGPTPETSGDHLALISGGSGDRGGAAIRYTGRRVDQA